MHGEYIVYAYTDVTILIYYADKNCGVTKTLFLKSTITVLESATYNNK